LRRTFVAEIPQLVRRQLQTGVGRCLTTQQAANDPITGSLGAHPTAEWLCHAHLTDEQARLHHPYPTKRLDCPRPTASR
jgi:hypothetical protein